MDLRLYDTLTREKRVFEPIDPKNVRMYVCGPTVYDFAHIGNARPVIVFDVLFRLLRHLYGEKHVTYVRNITDVDDKINDRAARDFPGLPLNEAIRKVTEITERQFHEDVDALGALRPSVEPRATEHIAEMRAIIEKLVAGRFAYVAEEHVLFSPEAMNTANSLLPQYGALSNRTLDEMIAGARVDFAPYKRGNTDFVLWKPSKPGEPSWSSPAGIKTPGRPGWHIECSAMAWKHLGEQFDIHGGGIDLVFPHHENELAQSCCAFHARRMANTWMHNGFLQVEGEKMSKSLGNFITIRELLADWPGEVLRLNMLKTHYRSPIDWTVSGLKESVSMLDGWKRAIASVPATQKRLRPNAGLLNALLDDLSVSDAIAELHDLAKFADKSVIARENLYSNLVFLGLIPNQFSDARRIAADVANAVRLPLSVSTHALPEFRTQIEEQLQKVSLTLSSSANTANTLGEAYRILNAGVLPTTSFLDDWKRYHQGYLSEADKRHVENTIGIAELNRLIEQRLKARLENNFDLSDEIRKKLIGLQITLKDRKKSASIVLPPTTWEVAR